MNTNRLVNMQGRVAQIAYAVADVEAGAAAMAARLGAGPFFVRHHPPMPCVDGAGRPGTFTHSSAYGQWGEVQVEVVTIHDDGPAPQTGIHHVARFVDDVDAEVERLATIGWPLVLDARTPSGTRFVFCDARTDLGHLVELYEPLPSLLALYAGVAAASRGWDGADPVRPLEALAERR